MFRSIDQTFSFFFIFNPTFFPSASNYLPKSFNKVEIKDTNWLKEGYFVY